MDATELDAGPFGAWVTGMQAALRGEQDADVPCGGCTGCCTSSQFVHVGPDESDALEHIPAELLFPAPGRPAGHMVLGYDERGHCPMLHDGGCSIYEHRPLTCRTYDCRIFPAAGLELVDPEKTAIAERAGRWRFRLSTLDDARRRDAVRATAAFVAEHATLLPEDVAPVTLTQHAVLAVSAHDALLEVTQAETPAETVARLRRHLIAPLR